MKGAAVLLLLGAVFSVFAQDTENYRLPTIIIPSNYDIEITPYFVPENNKLQFTFDGITKITLRTSQLNVMQIVLHAVNLNTTNNPTLVEAQDGFTSIPVTGSIDTLLTQKRTITLASALKPNQDYILTFIYVGQINNDMHGFYRSSYVENGTTKWMGTTQMQPTYARSVFPCFDEPSFKATFDIKLNRPNDFQPSVSNTRLTSSTNTGTRTREIFRRTPKMSTYLVAFIVSEFRLRENNNRSYGVLARPDAYSQTQYAYKNGLDTLAKLDEWMGYRYFDVPELEKMHLAALPDFDAGAMENWGLLTYRETALLYDPDVSTDLAQQKVACTIAHEIAHQWFGNLVTTDWWKFLWLNEGFGRFFQYFGAAMVETTWNLEQQFVVDVMHSILSKDASEYIHPLTHDANTPEEIADMFGRLTYNKGACIIRMIQHLIGAANFQAAMRTYIRANAFSTTTPEKFYFALQAQAGTTINIASLMNTWTTQAGYPVVTIERQSNVTYLVSQQRFLLGSPRNHSDTTLWEIPLNYASPNESFTSTNARFTLERTERSKIVQMQTDTPWKIFNIQQTGYYRVNYDNTSWTAIGNALKEEGYSGIHVLNRAQIVDDILNLARADYIDYYQALTVVQYMEKEENYIPWTAALTNLYYISRRLSNDELVKFKKYALALSKNVYAKLHFTQKSTDTRLDIYNRIKILEQACHYGHEECIKTAKEEFAKFETTTYRVPVNIRPVVYCTAIAEGGQVEWDFLWNKYLETNVAAERTIILQALGCSKNKAVLEHYLDLILTEAVRLQDKDTAFDATYISRNENVPIVLEYVYSNFEKISSVGKGMATVSNLLSALASSFTNEAQIERLQSFYTANSLLFANSRIIPNAINAVRHNIEWAQKHVPTIMLYLDDIQASSASLTSVSITLIVASLLIYLPF